MHALRARNKPSAPVAHQLLASIFGAGAVRVLGTFLTHVEASGLVRGASVRVLLEMANTQRNGTQPFTTIELHDELDVDVFTGSRHVVSSNIPFLPFDRLELPDTALYGAPDSLLESLVFGPTGDRLAILAKDGGHVSRLSVGRTAKKDGCATSGVHLVVAGWPEDLAALAFLIDTAIAIGLDARRELARPATRARMQAYDAARASSLADAKWVVAVVSLALSAGVLASVLAVVLQR